MPGPIILCIKYVQWSYYMCQFTWYVSAYKVLIDSHIFMAQLNKNGICLFLHIIDHIHTVNK